MDRVQLSDFLRTRRWRVTPASVGLPNGSRRRTPGLRRQEVAQLAGMSVDYYIRLEQGRGPRPSRQVLNALARALLLTIDERRHLFHLAGETLEPCSKPDRDVPAGIRNLLAVMDGVPGYVVDAKYDILAWNDLAAALMPGLFDDSGAPRNMIRAIFQPPAPHEAERAAHYRSDPAAVRFVRSTVADLRAAAARYPDDASIASLVDELLRGSPEFGELWAAHEVAVRRSMTKRIHHPTAGVLELECQVLLVPERDQRLILYVAEPGSPAEQALHRLSLHPADRLSRSAN